VQGRQARRNAPMMFRNAGGGRGQLVPRSVLGGGRERYAGPRIEPTGDGFRLGGRNRNELDVGQSGVPRKHPRFPDAWEGKTVPCVFVGPFNGGPAIILGAAHSNLVGRTGDGRTCLAPGR